VLGRACPSVAEVVGSIRWPSPAVDVGVVETVGGVRSPLAEDGDSRALVRSLGVDLVVLVADAGLGTIDAVRHAVDALAGLPVLVVLNRHDPSQELHLRNHRWLVDRDGQDVVVSIDALVARLAAGRGPT
jgi:dethiobiotin synthetase